MGALLYLTILLNIFDGVATWAGVSRGYAEELNPLMRFLIGHGFLWCFLVKNAMVAVGMLFIYANLDRFPRFGKAVMWVLFAFYAAIAALHIAVMLF